MIDQLHRPVLIEPVDAPAHRWCQGCGATWPTWREDEIGDTACPAGVLFADAEIRVAL